MGKIANIACHRNKVMVNSAQGSIGLYDLKQLVETGDVKSSQHRIYNNIVTECDSFDINDN